MYSGGNTPQCPMIEKAQFPNPKTQLNAEVRCWWYSLLGDVLADNDVNLLPVLLLAWKNTCRHYFV